MNELEFYVSSMAFIIFCIFILFFQQFVCARNHMQLPQLLWSFIFSTINHRLHPQHQHHHHHHHHHYHHHPHHHHHHHHHNHYYQHHHHHHHHHHPHHHHHHPSLSLLKFSNRPDDEFAVVGVAKDLVLSPRSHSGGSIHVYRCLVVVGCFVW